MSVLVTCETCGKAYGIGCSPYCKDGHERVMPSKGFAPYFDIGLGREVTGWGDVRQTMRRGHLDFRDHPSKAKLEERRERTEQQKKGRAA